MIAPHEYNMSLEVTAGGVTRNFHDGDITLEGIVNSEIVGVSRVSQKASFQRGHTDIGFDQSARLLTLAFRINAYTKEDYRWGRTRLISAFAPREEDPALVTFQIEDGRKLSIYGNLQGNMDMGPGGQNYSFQDVQIDILCPDPRFFDPNQQVWSFNPINNSSRWQMEPGGAWNMTPSGGWYLGPASIGSSQGLDYGIDLARPWVDYTAAPEYPIIRLTGPATAPIITNETTGDVIDLSGGGGLVIGAGDYVEIDLANGLFGDGVPTVRDQDGASVEQYLSTNSTLTTFHLAPKGELLPEGSRSTGTNIFSLSASGGSTATELRVTYYNRYLGF